MKDKEKKLKEMENWEPDLNREYIGKDGRKMNPNSLKNLKPGAFLRHPENIRPGRNKSAIKLVREQLRQVLGSEYWNPENKNNEQTLMLIIKDAVENYFKEKNPHVKQQWYKLLVGSIENTEPKSKEKPETEINADNVTIKNVVVLPPKNDEPKQINNYEIIK